MKAKYLGFFGIFCLFSIIASWLMVIIFADQSALKSPWIMMEFYKNISVTYPITVYPFLFFMGLLSLIIIYEHLKSDSEYGDAQFASNSEINNMLDTGLFEGKGSIFGLKDGRFLRTHLSLSTLIVAPQGTGKTAAVMIPTLLSDTSSFIINDIKGELWDKTSLQRSHFGKVGIFSPSKSLNGGLSWNPFDEKCLPESFESQIDFVDRIGAILYPTEQDGLDATSKHFNAEARSIFNFFTLYLIFKNGDTSLPDIFEFSLETDDVQGMIAIILEEEEEALPKYLVQNANRILQKEGKEFGASLTTFTQALEPFSRPTIAKNLKRCDFSHRDFRQEKPFSLYLFIPANDVARLAPLVRMLIEYLVNEFLSDNDQETIKRQRVVFAMDEFPRMGYMKALKEAPALQRSYNISSILIAQDKNQLETTYGRGSFDQFLTTTDFKIVFRQNEDTTAARFSNLVGKTTRKKTSISKKDMELLGSSSINSEGVPLILPQDFMNMKKHDLYLMIAGSYERPIKASCAWWFKDSNMKKLIGAYNDLCVSDLEKDTLEPKNIDETPKLLNINSNDEYYNDSLLNSSPVELEPNEKEQSTNETNIDDAYNDHDDKDQESEPLNYNDDINESEPLIKKDHEGLGF